MRLRKRGIKKLTKQIQAAMEEAYCKSLLAFIQSPDYLTRVQRRLSAADRITTND